MPPSPVAGQSSQKTAAVIGLHSRPANAQKVLAKKADPQTRQDAGLRKIPVPRSGCGCGVVFAHKPSGWGMAVSRMNHSARRIRRCSRRRTPGKSQKSRSAPPQRNMHPAFLQRRHPKL